MFNIKNILLTTDFSEFSLSAADQALSLAEKYNAKLHLIFVLEKTPPILAIRTLDLSEESIKESIEADAKQRLEEAVKKIKKEGIEILPVLKKGIDYVEINKYAEENNIDLIVLATHGRTGVLHTLIGSVAEKVIRHSKCPVLVVSSRDE